MAANFARFIFKISATEVLYIPQKKCKRKRKVNPVGRSMSFLGKRGYRPKEEVGNLPSQFLSFFYLEKNFNFGDIMKLCSNC